MSVKSVNIRKANAADAAQIAEIYNHYISNTIITFELEEIDSEEMNSRIQSIQKKYPFIVLEQDDQILAYAYASQWKERKAYQYTCESSIYVKREFLGHGYGFSLYKSLIDSLEKSHYRRVLGGIALPNDASIALHEKLGFTHSGTLTNVGFKFEKWVDVGYWQLNFD
ncbi:MAG: N-acetyltransferase [Bacteroidia bacterium]